MPPTRAWALLLASDLFNALLMPETAVDEHPLPPPVLEDGAQERVADE